MWFITGEFNLAIQVNGDTFDVWTLFEPILLDPQLVYENVPFIKLFVGISFDEETGKRQPKFDGNALLIEYKPRDKHGYHYMIISNYIETFTTPDRILKFYSPQNNASYPFAMTETHMYELVLHRIIPRFLPDFELHEWAFTHDVQSFPFLKTQQVPLPES